MGSAPGYAELHCHTNFSFLDGASHPEELAEEAARLGLAGLAVTDHDGLYGAVRFALGGARARPPDGLRRRADAGHHPARQRCSPIPRVSTSSCWPKVPWATRVWRARSAKPSWRERRARRASPSMHWPAPLARRCTSTRSRARTTTAGTCSPVVARARSLRHWCATARVRRAPRSTCSSPASVATGCWWRCGITAIPSTGTATMHWHAWPWPPMSTSSPPTTSTTPLPPGDRSPLRSPRCAPVARSTRSTAGSRPRPSRTCAARVSRNDASRAGRARSRARWSSRVRVRSTSGSPHRSCPITTCPTATRR